jgi:hypothetical protein
MRDWDEPPPPRGVNRECIERVKTALREIERGREPETQWEMECYTEAFARGLVVRPLSSHIH